MPLDTLKATLRAKINREGKKAGKKANWTFFVDGEEAEMKSVSKSSGSDSGKSDSSKEAVATIEFKPVDPESLKYQFTCSAGFEESAEEQTKLPIDWSIFPGVIELDVKPKAGKEEELKGQLARLRLQGFVRQGFSWMKLLPQFGAEVGKVSKIKVQELNLNDGPFDIIAVSPWQVEIKNGPGIKPKCEVEVSRLPYVAAIHSHAQPEGREEDDPIRQWVNIPASQSDKSLGQLVKLQIGADEQTNALKGDKFHIKITFPKSVKDPDGNSWDASTRNNPGPGVWLDKDGNKKAKPKKSAKFGEADVVFDFTGKDAIELKNDGEIIELFLQMGVAGGTTAKVEVGVTETVEDDKLFVQSWRKLFYQIQAPDFIELDNGDWMADTVSYVKKALNPCFIEFEKKDAVLFTEAEAGDRMISPCSLAGFKSDEIGRDKVYALPPGPRPIKAFTESGDRTIQVQVCDVGFSWTNEGYIRVDIDDLESLKDGDAYFYGVTQVHDKYCLFKDLQKGRKVIETDGFKWKADLPMGPTDEDGKIPHHNHPGRTSPGGSPKSGNMSAVVIEHNNLYWLEIIPPAEVAALSGALSDDKCPIKLSFKFLSCHQINGAAHLKNQVMVFKKDAPKCVGATICHELGHSMGMTIMPGQYPKPPSLDQPKHVDNGGVYYRQKSKSKDVVGKKGVRSSHVGPHCADGIADRATATDLGGKSGTCIMYGEGGSDDPPGRDSFCDECKTYLRARNLWNCATVEWEGRKPDKC